MKQLELTFCEWKYKMGKPLRKIAWQFLTKVIIYLLCDPTIAFLAIHSREIKTRLHKNTRTKIFTGALFIVEKTGNH